MRNCQGDEQDEDALVLVAFKVSRSGALDVLSGDETTATQMTSCLESFFFAFSGYLVTFDQEQHQQDKTHRVRQLVSFNVERYVHPNLTSVWLSFHSMARVKSQMVHALLDSVGTSEAVRLLLLGVTTCFSSYAKHTDLTGQSEHRGFYMESNKDT